MKAVEGFENASATVPIPAINNVSSVAYLPSIVLTQTSGRGKQKLSSERLDKAKKALAQTMNRANKIIEMIHYFRSFNVERTAAVRSASVHESVTQVLRAMSYEYPFTRITLVKFLPHDLPNAAVPREHLETILFQLIFQARRSIGERSGIITIEAREETCLSSPDAASFYLELRVADTGESLTDEGKRFVIDPITLSEESETRAGLGLYVVKRLVDMNRGSIRVETPPRGNSFYVRIPAVPRGRT